MSDQQTLSCHQREPYRCEMPSTHKVIYRGGVTFLCARHTEEEARKRPEDITKIFELVTGKDVTAEIILAQVGLDKRVIVETPTPI